MSNLVKTNICDTTWIEASAGTGKTKSLIDRILFLLLNGVRPSEILCITFTNAAASEMQARLYSITSYLSSAPDEKVIDFVRQIDGLPDTNEVVEKCRELYEKITNDEVKIQTIHSLCLSILRRFPSEYGSSKIENVVDTSEVHTLMDRAVNAVIQGKSADPVLANCIDFLGNHVEVPSIQEMLLAQPAHKDKYLSIFKDGLENLAGKYAEFFGISIDDLLEERIRSKSEIIYECLSKNASLFNELRAKISAFSEPKYVKLCDALDAVLPLSESSVDDLIDVFFTQKETLRKSLISPHLSESVTQVNDLLYKISDALSSAIEFSKSIISAKLSFSASLFAANVISKYEEIKAAEHLVEYDDILFRAREILSTQGHDWIRFKIESSIRHVLVDEAQDTNNVQWDIIKLLTAEFYTGESTGTHSLFVVGDVKQSIYSFQGADPSYFLSAREFFRTKSDESLVNFRMIEQNESYRSSPEILKFIDKVISVNYLSTALTNEQKSIRHIAYNRSRQSEVEVWPVEEAEEREFAQNWEFPIRVKKNTSSYAVLARKIARSVAEKINNNLYLPSKSRSAKPGDFMILFQRRSDFMFQVLRALKNELIPVSCIDKMQFNEHIAVLDILALCRFVLFPYDNLNLALLLKSPFFNISEDELMNICVGTSLENPIFDKLLSSNHQFAKTLSRWIEMSKYLSPYAFLSTVLEKEGYRKNLVGSIGDEVSEIIDELMEFASDFENSEQHPDLFEFLYAVQRKDLRLNSNNSDSNSVKLMTVHAAKGMQAPCVILADSTFYNNRIENYIWSDLMFFCPNMTNAPRPLLKLRDEESRKKENEYLRLLYVAMTRAEDALFIAGSKSEKSLNKRCWYNLITSAMKSSNYSSSFSTVFDGYVFKTGGLKINRHERRETARSADRRQMYTNSPRLKAIVKEHPIETKNSVKGVILHDILANYIKGSEQEIDMIINRNLVNAPVSLNEQELDDIKHTADSLIKNPDLNWIFGQNSLTELPFIIKSGPRTKEGRIDRIVVSEGSVNIIEIKTGTKNDVLNKRTEEQLNLCRDFAAFLYPDKEINVHILWTKEQLLQKIDLNKTQEVA